MVLIVFMFCFVLGWVGVWFFSLIIIMYSFVFQGLGACLVVVLIALAFLLFCCCWLHTVIIIQPQSQSSVSLFRHCFDNTFVVLCVFHHIFWFFVVVFMYLVLLCVCFVLFHRVWFYFLPFIKVLLFCCLFIRCIFFIALGTYYGAKS